MIRSVVLGTGSFLLLALSFLLGSGPGFDF